MCTQHLRWYMSLCTCLPTIPEICLIHRTSSLAPLVSGAVVMVEVVARGAVVAVRVAAEAATAGEEVVTASAAVAMEAVSLGLAVSLAAQ